jgi:hypothetical protein
MSVTTSRKKKRDGIGMDPTAPPRGTGLGRRMVPALAAQIGGTFQTGRGANGGPSSPATPAPMNSSFRVRDARPAVPSFRG